MSPTNCQREHLQWLNLTGAATVKAWQARATQQTGRAGLPSASVVQRVTAKPLGARQHCECLVASCTGSSMCNAGFDALTEAP